MQNTTDTKMRWPVRIQILFLLQVALFCLGFYMCIEGVLKNSQTYAGSGGLLIGVAVVGIIITINYKFDIEENNTTIIVIETENPINIVNKENEKKEQRELDPSALV
jgi:hypothetical protein